MVSRPPVVRSTLVVVATRTGVLTCPPARTRPLSTRSPAASLVWRDTPRVPPAVIGTVAVIAWDRSVTLPAELVIAPPIVRAVVAVRATSPLVRTALEVFSVPAASMAIGRREAGTASTIRSSDSATLIA